MFKFPCPRCGRTVKGPIAACPHCGLPIVYRQKDGSLHDEWGNQIEIDVLGQSRIKKRNPKSPK